MCSNRVAKHQNSNDFATLYNDFDIFNNFHAFYNTFLNLHESAFDKVL